MTTKSLKSCIPELARVLGETTDALYERQRALDREGLLESRPGRGPGSGVRATPESIAMLLIGLLASVSLSDAGARARDIAKTKNVGKTAEIFKDALARILSDDGLAAAVKVIRVAVTHGYASIESETGNTVFMGRKPGKSAVRVDVAIDADTVRALAKLVSELK
jgi:hypothetical protein